LKPGKSNKGVEKQSQSSTLALWFTRDTLSKSFALGGGAIFRQGNRSGPGSNLSLDVLLESLRLARRVAPKEPGCGIAAVNQEVDRRLKASAQDQARDHVFRLLLGVRRTHEGFRK
jgi:hypothetical protein